MAEVKKNKPGIILLDLMMPKMNGIETLKFLKEDPQTSSIPVIILTNLGDREDDIQKAKDMGALDYLVKSQIDLAALSARAKKAIEAGT